MAETKRFGLIGFSVPMYDAQGVREYVAGVDDSNDQIVAELAARVDSNDEALSALEERMSSKVDGTDDGTYIALPNGRSLAVQGGINCSGGIVVPNGAVTASAIIINNVQYSAETWEFTLSDDSTVQKQLLVAPVETQGGA